MTPHSHPSPLPPLGDSAARLAAIRLYLEREWLAQPEGSRLPPVREVATLLKTSTAAVYTVYRELQAEGRVVAVVGRGTFLAPHQPKRILRIALATVPEGGANDTWKNRLVQAVLSAAKALPSLTIHPMAKRQVEEEVDISPLDGLIFLPREHPGWSQIEARFRQAGKPVVSINPPNPFETANFVSADYFHFALNLAQTWLESGRRQLLIIGGEQDRPSWVQRLAGFQTAVGKADDVLKICYAGYPSYENGFRAMNRLLESGYRPDAVFTFGDFLALGARDALKGAGLSIPGEVSIVGGSGLQSTQEAGISTHLSNDLEIGHAALAMLMARLENGGEPRPAAYVPLDLAAAGSTRPFEHTLWRRLTGLKAHPHPYLNAGSSC